MLDGKLLRNASKFAIPWNMKTSQENVNLSYYNKKVDIIVVITKPVTPDTVENNVTNKCCIMWNFYFYERKKSTFEYSIRQMM